MKRISLHIQLFLAFILLIALSCSRPAEPVLEEKVFTLTITSEGQGSVNQRIINEVDYATVTPKRVEITANPKEGWEFSEWSGDATSSANPLNVTIDKHKFIIASFTQVLVDVTNPFTGRTWMDRNLGASRAAISSTASYRA